MSDAPRQPKHSKPIPAGTVLAGRYVIEGFLGEGGFAAVYRGVDRAIERPVAIKILYAMAATMSPSAQAQVLERFQREAKTAARVRHSNVITIFDIGLTDENQPYIVMELLEGSSLDEEIDDRGAMSPRRSVKLFIQCLEALAEAHDLGIVHKDLKPGNLFIIHPETSRETLAILDFGIAGVTEDEDARLTSTGQLMGTPRYMAPEYIRDQTLSPKVDVYQMGLILIEMLTGKPAVDKDSLMSCIMVHTTQGISVPPQFITGPLGPVIKKATAIDPDKRYPDAEAFRTDLMALDLSAIPDTSAGAPQKRVRTPTITGPPPNPKRDTLREDPSDLPPDTRPDPAAPTERFPSTGSQRLKPAIVAVIVLFALIFSGVLIALLVFEDPKTPDPPPEAAKEAPPKTPKAQKDPPKAPSPKPKAPKEPTNPWITIDPPSKTVLIGLDPAVLGLTPRAWARIRTKIDAFTVEAGIKAPTAAYRIQAREVTWAELEPWLQDHGDHSFPKPTWVPEDKAERAPLPAAGMLWKTAEAYCASISGRLPTEEEWEYAARGPQRRPFPWGDTLDSPEALGAYRGPEAAPAPPGSSDLDRTPGKAPIFDMMGNVQEWTGSPWRSNTPEGDASWATGASTYKPIRGFPLDKVRPGKKKRPARVGAAFRQALCAEGPCVQEYPDARRLVGFRCAQDLSR